MVAPLRIGVVGAGWFASRRHLPDIRRTPGVALAALCRRSVPELARMAEAFEVSLTFTDYERMLAEAPLDAVLIATPHALHYPHARAALERGLHVLVEKPLAITAAEAEELARLAAERGRVLSTALNPPFWAHCCYLRALREQGVLGEIEGVQIAVVGSVEHVFGRTPLPHDLPGVVPPTLFRGDPALNGGGNLMDSGAHLVSELLWVTGLTPRAVSARMDALPTDMRAVLTVELSAECEVPSAKCEMAADGHRAGPGETSGQRSPAGTTGSSSAPTSHFALRTSHSTGPVLATISLVGDSRFPRRRVHSVYYGSRATAAIDGLPFQVTVTPADGPAETRAEADLPPVLTPVADFAAAIRDRRVPASPPEHAVAVTRLLEAAYRAAATGERMELGE